MIQLLSYLSKTVYSHLSKEEIEERLSPVAYPLREHFACSFLEDDKALYEPDSYVRAELRNQKASST
jgi:hypothetical protein